MVCFELRNARYVKAVHSGSKSYTCGDVYCDELTIVVQLTTKVMDSGDPAEPLSRMPVFQIETLADVQGVYKADGGK